MLKRILKGLGALIAASGRDFALQISEITGNNLRRSAGTATTSGTQLSFTASCPPPGEGGASGDTVGYSATGTTFTIFEPSNGEIHLNVYTRRTGNPG